MRGLCFLSLLACSEPAATLPQNQPAAILLLESDYISGLVSGWNSGFTERVGETAVDGDAHLVELGDQFGVFQRGHGDNLLLIKADLEVKNQWALTHQSNPQDGLLVGDELWVSLYHEPYVLRLDASSGEERSRIDLHAFSDADGRPEATDLHATQEGNIHLLVQNLDFRGVEPIPPDQSRLLTFNSQGELLHSSAIPANPYGTMVELDDGTLLIACNRSWDVDQEAGLWHFNPATQTGSFVVQEDVLQGNILSFSVSDNAIFLVVAKADFTTEFRRITRADLELSEPFGGASQHLGCVATLSNGQTWVCDRQPGAFGLRQIDAQKEQIAEALISTSMAPLMILENQGLQNH